MRLNRSGGRGTGPPRTLDLPCSSSPPTKDAPGTRLEHKLRRHIRARVGMRVDFVLRSRRFEMSSAARHSLASVLEGEAVAAGVENETWRRCCTEARSKPAQRIYTVRPNTTQPLATISQSHPRADSDLAQSADDRVERAQDVLMPRQSASRSKKGLDARAERGLSTS